MISKSNQLPQMLTKVSEQACFWNTGQTSKNVIHSFPSAVDHYALVCHVWRHERARKKGYQTVGNSMEASENVTLQSPERQRTS